MEIAARLKVDEVRGMRVEAGEVVDNPGTAEGKAAATDALRAHGRHIVLAAGDSTSDLPTVQFAPLCVISPALNDAIESERSVPTFVFEPGTGVVEMASWLDDHLPKDLLG